MKDLSDLLVLVTICNTDHETYNTGLCNSQTQTNES